MVRAASASLDTSAQGAIGSAQVEAAPHAVATAYATMAARVPVDALATMELPDSGQESLARIVSRDTTDRTVGVDAHASPKAQSPARMAGLATARASASMVGVETSAKFAIPTA